MLSEAQIQAYHDDGYILVEDVVTGQELEELRRLTYEKIDQSRAVSVSDEVFDLDEGHSKDNPKLTRIKMPHIQMPAFWDVLKSSKFRSVLEALLGPAVRLQTSKLNTKAPGGGAAVEWHQDWAFYPHTNDDVLAIGLMLEDVEEESGPLLVIPGTHKGPVLSHFVNGVFAGAIDPSDPLFEKDKIVTLTGKAGSMTVHHCRTLHGSAPNVSNRARLICFYEMCAADAWPLAGGAGAFLNMNQRQVYDTVQSRIIFGEQTMRPRLKDVPVLLPLPPAPDATSIFKTQKSAGAVSAFAKADQKAGRAA
ncbi:phytanoyl-CoA dioxygenase family protein [Labrys sp. LIt4]|uniref:Phytanoyl-CoA dioxygenase n=1 Tax=Labrys okinawensis TaxID=346911 RepID=A0A2S9QHC4_9HYPH|nr:MULTISPECIES: phytanoyl-CoA dioxygenase family protein [Labrys]MBP0579674.1 phytanoyl-CoA dioxygenase family protein [Labrys sp. LIt4]PRH88766.1 phytanoyl-CoA dioxygenase [Labrys okinawensis]